MTLWAIVPVKPLRLGKSRLSDVLSEDERTRLNRMFLEHTLGVLREVKEIDQILVVSRDPAALAVAREFGARTVQEDGRQHLNAALARATAVAQHYGARGVLILPADLPLLLAEDLHRLVELGREAPVVVLAPDRRRDGTNALLISPPGLIQYAFGARSFEGHSELARNAGAALEILETPALSLDIDLPEDLDYFRQQAGAQSAALLADLHT